LDMAPARMVEVFGIPSDVKLAIDEYNNRYYSRATVTFEYTHLNTSFQYQFDIGSGNPTSVCFEPEIWLEDMRTADLRILILDHSQRNRRAALIPQGFFYISIEAFTEMDTEEFTEFLLQDNCLEIDV